ncbi:MAG: 1-acyl-sn-glycerol-3-phosphate acyltransferase, partial [Campylobacterales bacterium]|nr:1-acyl-sn-glycerol-3-phosphate acyltransferase [Campylobacterales bacterium]
MVLNVEEHIDSVVPKLNTKHIIKLAKKVIKEDDINNFIQVNSHLSGLEFVDAVLDYFEFDFKVSGRELLNIPTTGKVMIVANHPLGGLDGLILIKLISQVRKDVKIVANEFLNIFGGLKPMILSVDVFGEKTRKRNIKEIYHALENEEAVIMFPSGEVSRAGLTGIKDGKWKKSFLNFSLKTQSPIVPVFLEAKNSKTFYTVSTLSSSLATFLLPNEMFKNRKKAINITIGEAILPQDLNVEEYNKKDLAKRFRKHVYNLPKKKKLQFKTQKAIAHPEKTNYVKKELERSEILLDIDDKYKLYLYEYRKDDSVLKEIGRLRELSFRKVGE